MKARATSPFAAGLVLKANLYVGPEIRCPSVKVSLGTWSKDPHSQKQIMGVDPFRPYPPLQHLSTNEKWRFVPVIYDSASVLQ